MTYGKAVKFVPECDAVQPFDCPCCRQQFPVIAAVFGFQQYTSFSAGVACFFVGKVQAEQVAPSFAILALPCFAAVAGVKDISPAAPFIVSHQFVIFSHPDTSAAGPARFFIYKKHAIKVSIGINFHALPCFTAVIGSQYRTHCTDGPAGLADELNIE